MCEAVLYQKLFSWHKIFLKNIFIGFKVNKKALKEAFFLV